MALPHVSKLVALVFDDPYKAEEARAVLHRLGGEGLLEIEETTLIVRFADGRTRVSQDVDVAADGQRIGHVAGLVTAALTGTLPFVAAGTLLGRIEDRGRRAGTRPAREVSARGGAGSGRAHASAGGSSCS